MYLTSVTTYTYHVWLYFIIINQGCDVEENPGPHYNSCQSFSIFHWNLNSNCAHNVIKLYLLYVYFATNQCDIWCLSKIFLDSSILSDDSNLDIPWFNLVRADRPVLTKPGDVYLLSKILDIHFLHECINFEMRIRDKVYNFFVYIDHQDNLLKN